MKTEKSVICGKHIRFIRNYLALTQAEFGEKLGEWGIKDKSGSPGKTAEIVASWESGRNQVPNKVLRAIYDNVKYNGKTIQWAYLAGDTDFITQDIDGILTYVQTQLFPALPKQNAKPESQSQWHPMSPDEITELANSHGNKLALILEEELLPLYGYTRGDIFDHARFLRKIDTMLQNEIESFIIDEKNGK